MENHGTDPDIKVPLGPSDWENGEDLQLDVAADETLVRLEEKPAMAPPELPPAAFIG